MSRTPLLLGLLLSLTTTVVLAEENASVQEAKHLTNIKQVTFGLPRAGEGYFSPDGKAIIFQAYPIGYPFYQIYVQNLDERVPKRVSP